MEEYKNKLNKLNSDKKFVDRISAEEDKLYCYNSDIELAEEKGKTEAKIELAKNLFKLDVDIKIIKEATGMSEEEILSLKDSN